MTSTVRDKEPVANTSSRSWRATTAIRVFVLALATGQLLSSGSFSRAAPMLVALLFVAMMSSTLEFGVADRRVPWVPLVEGILAASLLSSALPIEALLVYLAVPTTVAGVRHGWVTATNTALATTAAVGAANWAYTGVGLDMGRLATSAPWIVIGFGAGLLASWQTRALRDLEARQAPYAAAHDLLVQLHSLTRNDGVGLDSRSVAGHLAATVREEVSADGATVYLNVAARGLEPYAHAGAQADAMKAATLCHKTGRPVASHHRACLPLRVNDRSFGVLALTRARGWSGENGRSLQRLVDQHALRLETALLFEDVRLMATSEERNRLAREIHDGLAQEIVALGYLVDEVEAETTEPSTLAATSSMRDQITRLVGELRFSIFDLRHEMRDQNLSGALAEYVREISAGSDLRVHLLLDEQGPPLPRRTEAELLRITQEAIANVRKHAHALNLWVTLETDGTSVRLLVEDDGIGSAAPKDRHYGLHTMRERAQKINADLTVSAREYGGTIVSLRTRPPSAGEEIASHEHHSPAGR